MTIFLSMEWLHLSNIEADPRRLAGGPSPAPRTRAGCIPPLRARADRPVFFRLVSKIRDEPTFRTSCAIRRRRPVSFGSPLKTRRVAILNALDSQVGSKADPATGPGSPYQGRLNTNPCSDHGSRVTRVPLASKKASKAQVGARIWP